MTGAHIPAPFRQAVAADAAAVATFFNLANAGLGDVLWRMMCAPGETPETFGIRAMRERIENGEVVVSGDPGAPLAGMISQAQPPHADPLPEDVPAPLRVIHGLRLKAPETWFITTVAVRPAARGRGLGKALLELAEEMARDAGLSATGLLVLAHNTNARRLYDRLGYGETGRDRIVQTGWPPSPEDIILMTKPVTSRADGKVAD